MSLALALLADMRAEHRSRGLRRTAEHIETDELNRTAAIIRTALRLDGEQVHELFEAWSDLFGRHFTDMERRQAEADAQRLEEIRSFIPAARDLWVRDEQAAAAYRARREIVADDDADADDGATKGTTPSTDGSELTASGGGDPSPHGEPPPDVAQQHSGMARDLIAFAASSERIEQIEDLERATQLHASRFLRDDARRSGIAMPGDNPPAATPPWPAAKPGHAAPSIDYQPRSDRERRAASLKCKP